MKRIFAEICQNKFKFLSTSKLIMAFFITLRVTILFTTSSLCMKSFLYPFQVTKVSCQMRIERVRPMPLSKYLPPSKDPLIPVFQEFLINLTFCRPEGSIVWGASNFFLGILSYRNETYVALETGNHVGSLDFRSVPYSSLKTCGKRNDRYYGFGFRSFSHGKTTFCSGVVGFKSSVV